MRLFRILALLSLVALAGAGYWYFVQKGGTVQGLMAGAKPGAGAPAAPAGGPPGGMAMPVEATPVRVDALARTVTAVGSLLSNESVIVRPEVTGRISEIAFNEGQRVQKGAVLVRLDDAIARATLAQAQSSLAFSRSELQRAEELFRQNAGSARTREQAQSKLLADEAMVTLARAQLEKLVLTAPFDGVLGLRKVSVGDYVQPGKDIVNLEAIDTLKLDFRVPEMYLPTVKLGQKLAVAVDAFPNRSFAGEVYAIDPQVDVNGRAVVIRARVPNTGSELRPGLFARVELTLTVKPDAILVPEQAVVAFGNVQFVYRVVDGKAQQVRVKLGARRGGEVEIMEGLGPKDEVITGGQLKIRDGAPVKVINAAEAAKAAGGPGAGAGGANKAPGEKPAGS